ncbi:MAG: hypothetical protein ABI557_03110 [Aureliella sp.]
MTFPEPVNPSHAVELRHWVIAIHAAQTDDISHLAVWRMAKPATHNNPMTMKAIAGSSNELDALALFTDQIAAERYAEQYRADEATSFQVIQFSATELLSVLAESYRVGMRYAALNPSGTSTQQLFILRDVLAAAQNSLRQFGNV